jgi:hypothetical protein
MAEYARCVAAFRSLGIEGPPPVGASPKWFKAAEVVRSLAALDPVVAAVQDRIDIIGGQIEIGSRDPGLRGSEIGWDRH